MSAKLFCYTGYLTFHPKLRKASADAVWSKQMVRGAKSRGPRDHCGVTSFLLRLVKLTLSPIPAEADNQANLGRRRSATFNVLLELLVSSLTKLGVGYEESSLLQVYKIYDNTVRTQRL